MSLGASPRPEIQRRQRNAAKVIAYFRAHQGEYVDVPTLERLGGRNAWRTRVSDARAVFCDELGWEWPVPKGGRDPILNRQQRIVVVEPDGRKHVSGAIISEYRYWPVESLGRAADVPAPDRWPAYDAPIQETWRLT